MYQLIVRPLIQRLGSATGAALGALGMTSGEVSTVESAFVILAGFAFDLVIRRLF